MILKVFERGGYAEFAADGRLKNKAYCFDRKLTKGIR